MAYRISCCPTASLDLADNRALAANSGNGFPAQDHARWLLLETCCLSLADNEHVVCRLNLADLCFATLLQNPES